MPGMYLDTDEQRDVLISIAELDRQLARVETDVQAWKFAIVSLMFAVNGALVCFLTGTMNMGALRSDIAEKLRESREPGSTVPLPEPRLAQPEDLLKRAKGGKRYDTARKVLAVSDGQSSSFELLVYFRNQFTHFSPIGWSIEYSGLPERFLDVLGIIESVNNDSWAFRHLDEDDRAELSQTLLSIRQRLQVLSQNYASSTED